MSSRDYKPRFVRVPIWWMLLATEATHTKQAMVAIELLLQSWRKQRMTFPLPSGRLKRHGISRMTTWRALQQLKKRGLITIEMRGQKAPLITFTVAP
jgi:hypothetical protein